MLEVGFADTYPFRFLFRPLGYITNVWAEVLLLILGWLCLARRHVGFLVFLTIGAILLSFSRGAYIALAVYMALWLALIKPLREKVRVPLLALLALLLVGLSFPAELGTTLAMNRTVSQRQSTSGRIDATRASWEAFRERPLLGYGNGNYTLAIDKALNQDSTRSYTSLAPNLPVQLLVEKRIVGLGLYLFLLIAIVQSLWERRKERESRVVFCLLSALAIKEMTQASLLGTHFALFLLAISLVFPQGDENGSVEKTETVSVWDYGLPVVVLLCYFVYVGFVFRKEREDQRLRAIESAWKRGEWGEALRLMERAGERTPDLVNRALLYGRAYRETGDIMHLADAEKALREARRRQPEDVQIEYLWTCLYLDKRESGKAADIAAILTNLGENDVLEQAYSPMTVRFFILQAHYRSPLDFSNEALKAAEKGYERLMAAVKQLDKLKASTENTVDVGKLRENCFEAINDDLNTPILISHLFEGVHLINSIAAGNEKIDEENLAELRKLFHDFVFDILGLKSEADSGASNEALGKVIDAMMNVRKAARANKDWATSDRIRDELKNAGIQIKDTKEGYEWSLEN